MKKNLRNRNSVNFQNHVLPADCIELTEAELFLVNGGQQVSDSNAAVAGAQVGDTITRENGQTITLNQGDIDYAKAQIGGNGSGEENSSVPEENGASDKEATKIPVYGGTGRTSGMSLNGYPEYDYESINTAEKMPDGIYYLENGKYIATVGQNPEDIYTMHGTQSVYVCNKTDFDNMTAAVVGEASVQNILEEANAIADVIMNCSKYAKVSTTSILEEGKIYGWNEDSRNRAKKEMYKNADKGILNARAAIIDAYIGTVDSSKGAYFWEGSVYLNPKSSYYSTNNWYVKSGWGTTPGTESGIINYLETTRLGGTIFLKNNPEYRGASYP